MVYKTGKYGTRSGATFKARCRRYLERYTRCATIERSHSGLVDDPTFKHTGLFGEGKAMTDRVEYSLNKQRRWELPGVIEDLIRDKSDDDGDDIQYQIVQRHRIKKYANVFSVASTAGIYSEGSMSKEKRTKKSKNCRNLFQSNTVLTGKPAMTKREKRNKRRQQRRMVNDTDVTAEENEGTKGQVHYEVTLPAPSSSALAHMPKYNGNNTHQPFVWRGYQDKRGKHRIRTRLERHILEDVDMMDEDLLSDEENYIPCVVEETYTEPEITTKDYSINLEEIIKHANTVESLFRGRRQRHGSGSTSSDRSERTSKGHVVYLEKQDSASETSNNPTSTNPTHTIKEPKTEFIPVTVILNNAEMDLCALQNNYGQDFIVTDCFPTKYILKLSEKTTRGVRLAHGTDAVLIFVYDAENEINTVNESVYKVYLNCNVAGNLKSIKIETIFDFMETSVAEIIKRAVFYLDTLPDNSLDCDFLSKGVIGSYKSSVTRKTTMEQCANWSTSTYRPNNAFFLQHLCKDVDNSAEAKMLGYDVVCSQYDADCTDREQTAVDRFCSICYESLDGNRQGTALVSCFHWFCNSCWKEYLETEIDRGSLKLQCPEYDCAREVDAGTMMSLVGLHDVIKHARHCHDSQVEKQAISGWCPNTRCGRVVNVNSEATKTARCICGERFCIECQSKWHWPAPCDAVKAYNDQIRRTGDIGLLPEEMVMSTEINGRKCPSCNKFVEKNGGCPYMYCVCRKAFCWGCGEPWDGRTHGSRCYKEGSKNKHRFTTRFEFEPDSIENKNREAWYKTAIRHRLKQHPARVKKMKSNAKTFINIVHCHLLKSRDHGEEMSLDSQADNVASYADRARDFVLETIDMYVEAQTVLENASILVGSDVLFQEDKPKVRYIINRLSAFLESLFDLLAHTRAGPRNDAKLVVQNVKNLRLHCRRNISSLLKIVKSHDT